MTWVAAAVVGGAVIGGVASNRAAGKAAGAQTSASNAAIAAQEASELRALQISSPWRQGGRTALDRLLLMEGLAPIDDDAEAYPGESDELIGDTYLPSGTTTKSVGKGWYEVWNQGTRVGTLRPGGPNGRYIADGNPMPEQPKRASPSAPTSEQSRAAFESSPGYQFRLDEGMRAVERGAAARGILNSGGTIRSATRYAQDYASNEYQRVFDRIATIAGYGRSATEGAANTIVNTGANVGRALTNAGDARASGYVAQGNAWANAANQIGTAAGYGMFGKIGGGGGGYTPPGTMNYDGYLVNT